VSNIIIVFQFKIVSDFKVLITLLFSCWPQQMENQWDQHILCSWDTS